MQGDSWQPVTRVVPLPSRQSRGPRAAFSPIGPVDARVEVGEVDARDKLTELRRDRALKQLGCMWDTTITYATPESLEKSFPTCNGPL